MSAVVTLMSDFGTADGYAAAMKGVLLSVCREVVVVDATHEIPPQDVRAGAWALRRYWNLYPKGTVHVAVVDPGVGSSRKPLLVQADGRWLLGPDNGLFSWVLREARSWTAWKIAPSTRRSGGVGETFHGRDVFAYAAGLLASGAPRERLARVEVEPIRFAWPTPRKVRGEIRGEIVHLDRFGNAVSNIPAALISWPRRSVSVECGSFRVESLSASYASARVGRPVAVVESSGLVELSLNGGSAAESFALAIGAAVRVWNAGFGR